MEKYYQLLSILPGIAILVVLFLCFFNKVKLATSIGIMALSFYPFTIGYIYQFTLLPNEINTIFSPVVPYSIAGALVAMAIIAVIPNFLSSLSLQNHSPKWTRWLWLIIGVFLIFVGIALALMFWYTPYSLGLSAPSPIKGVIAYNIVISISALLMLLASRINSAKRPNLMRKIITILIMFGVSQITLVLSLILIYSFPSESVTSYPKEGSLIYGANLVWGALLLAMNKSTTNKAEDNEPARNGKSPSLKLEKT